MVAMHTYLIVFLQNFPKASKIQLLENVKSSFKMIQFIAITVIQGV